MIRKPVYELLSISQCRRRGSDKAGECGVCMCQKETLKFLKIPASLKHTHTHTHLTVSLVYQEVDPLL